ncbi:MAG: PAS domain S-box protein, partial [Myxococcales bacterium]
MSSAPKRVAESQATRLVENLPTALVHALDEQVTYANEEAGRLLGGKASDLIGRTIFDFVAREDLLALEQRYWARQRGERVPSTYELSLVQLGGDRVLVELEVRRLAEREQIFLLRDISDRVRDAGLVVALSEVSVRLRRARTVDEVLRVAGEGVRNLGLQFTALRIDGDALEVVHLAAEPEFQAMFEQLRRGGGRLPRVPLANLRAVPKVLERRTSLFFDDIR